MIAIEALWTDRFQRLRGVRNVPPDTMPKLENPWHADRVKTLRRAAELYGKEPDNFLTLEVCV